VRTKNFPTLYKRTATGAVQEWHISVQENRDGTATVCVTQGQQGGAKQTYEDQITEGKNVGKKNETSVWDQACNEAQSEWNKKKDRKHYGLTVEESAGKRELAPMLAQKYQDHFKKVDWGRAYAQPKLDGHRCLARREGKEIKLWTREGKPILTVPHIVEDLRSVMRDGDCFDGELYIHGVPLARISSYIKRAQEGSTQLQYRLYDLATDTMDFADRLAALEQRLGKDEVGALHLVDTIRVPDEKKLMAFQATCIEEGFEGAMLRWGDFGYEPGKRSHSLLKVKTFVDDEFEIVGVKEGRGTHKGMAIFTCKTADSYEFDVTAPGSHEEKRTFWANRAELIGKMLTVKYQCYTATEEPVPFLPIAKALRED
jgi:DNA ligase-1